METPPLPSFIHAGVQKAGSTWIYQALKEPPEIYMSHDEPTNYFDVEYYRGEGWYRERFGGYDGEKEVGDESPGYIKHPFAARRAAELIPEAKIIMCLRDPVERAYSQWWSAESYWTDGRFERCMFHHATNDVFVTPGFYYYHISKWEEYYPKDNIKITFFEDMISDNEKFIKDLYSFLGVDDEFLPDIANNKVQSGKSRKGPNERIKERLMRYAKKMPNLTKQAAGKIFGYKEYEKKDMSESMKIKLQKTYYEDIRKLENRTGRNLERWTNLVDGGGRKTI